MKLKYTGLAPITNKFGDWKHGDVKEVPDGTILIGFEAVESEAPREWTRRVVREELQDKMERDNLEIKRLKRRKRK